MSLHLGSYNTATTRTHVGFQFSTHAAAGGNAAPASAFEAADLRIYRAANSAAFSATQRSSSNGVTVTSPFDSLTGVHDVDIDLADNSDAGFYAAGYRYSVMLCPDTETVDSQTITGVVLAYFEIGPPPVNVTQVNGQPASESTLTAADVADAVRTELTTELGRIDVASSTLATQASLDQVDTDLTTLLGRLTSTRADYLDNLSGGPVATAAALAVLLTTAMTESYSADGAAPTPAQAILMILQRLTEFSKSGTVITVKKLDGTTAAFTLTLDDATNPTSSTRST